MRITSFLFLVLLTSTGCMSFPYEGLIEESERYLKATARKDFSYLELENGKKLHYFRQGNTSQPLVIFVHGSPGGWQSYAHFFKNERLKSHFDLIAFDRLGYGNLQPSMAEGDLKKQIRPIVELAKSLGKGRKVILVGHSYGGPVVGKAAVERPDLFHAVMFVAASLDPKLEETKWFQYPAQWWIFNWMVPSALDVCNKEILALKDQLEILKAQWSRLKQPTYVIHGKIDELVPIENVDFMKEQIKNAPVVYKIVPEMRHFVPWSFPDLIEEGIFYLNDQLRMGS